MTREEVYKSIDTEREYQKAQAINTERPDMIQSLSVTETIIAIRRNLDKAESAWYCGSHPHHPAMEYLRKIAGLCVQAGEHHEMPSR